MRVSSACRTPRRSWPATWNAVSVRAGDSGRPDGALRQREQVAPAASLVTHLVHESTDQRDPEPADRTPGERRPEVGSGRRAGVEVTAVVLHLEGQDVALDREAELDLVLGVVLVGVEHDVAEHLLDDQRERAEQRERQALGDGEALERGLHARKLLDPIAHADHEWPAHGAAPSGSKRSAMTVTSSAGGPAPAKASTARSTAAVSAEGGPAVSRASSASSRRSVKRSPLGALASVTPSV